MDLFINIFEILIGIIEGIIVVDFLTKYYGAKYEGLKKLSLYHAGKNYQQQEVTIVNMPRSGNTCESKKIVFQSHFEVLGAYPTGYMSICTSEVRYIRNYS